MSLYAASRIRIFVLLAVVSCKGYAATAAESDPVLTVWAQSPDKAWIGTGFLINQDAQFITCYHVIRGATQLKVFQNKNAYQDVEVVAIAPDHDLAILQVNH